MEASGTITFVASSNDTLVITGISDSTEPYAWTPANSTDAAAFYALFGGLTDKSLTVTFNDNANVRPFLCR